MKTEILTNETIQTEAFTKHLGMFAFHKGANLIERTKPLGRWVDERTNFSTWPYSRSLRGTPSTVASLSSQNGRVVEGINFGSQDYLGLSQHDAIRDAAIAALIEYGPHGSGLA